jgi:hypothetical protein
MASKAKKKGQEPGGQAKPRKGENQFSAGANVVYSAKSDLMAGASSNRGKGGK